MALSPQVCKEIGGVAAALVIDERSRQVKEKGWTYEHDDQHGSEELAAAAAFYLLPAWMNPDVVSIEEGALEVKPLSQVIGDGAWDDIDRDYDDPDTELDLRIDTVVRGAALALAELERLMRIREAAASQEGRDA